MAELGALSLRIQEEGGEVVLAKLRQIDNAARITGDRSASIAVTAPGAEQTTAALKTVGVAATQADAGAVTVETSAPGAAQAAQALGAVTDAGKRTTVSADEAAAALNSLGIAAKVVDGSVTVADRELERAASIVRQLGSDAKVTAGEVERLASSTAKLSAAKPFLGPGLPTTTTDSAARASAAALLRSEAAAEQAISRRIQLLAQGARLESTRADAIRRLIGVEAGLTAALKQGNLTQEQRIRLNVLLTRTQAAVASGTENVAAAQAAKLAADRASIDAAHGEALAMDRQRTAADKMSPKIRSGASAIAALAIAATTGGGSLAGMATQVGLVGSVMAAEFAPAKWAGYAAGIGAVVIGITALIGIMAKLRAEQAKPSPAVLQRIEDIKRVTDAETEYTRHRKETDRLEAELANRPRGFLPPHEQMQELTRVEKLQADLKRARELESAAFKQFQALRNQSIIDDAQVATQAITAAAEATKAVRLSEIAKEQAAVEAAFQAGTASLAEQYDARRKAIVDGAKAERAAMEAQRAALLRAVPGEDPEGAEAKGRRVEAGAISAEIKALANETAARLTALDQQRAADERSLAAKVLGYQVQLEQFSDTAFQRRMEQINAEAAEHRRTLNQRGNATEQELADLDALTEKKKTQLFLEKAQADLARLREDLAIRLQDVENRRLAGLISEEQASREIVDITRSALPTLRESVDRAIALAEKLGQQGVLGELRAIKAELSAPLLLDIDIDSDAITRRLNAALDRIRSAVNRGVLDAETGRQLVQQEQFGAGIAAAIADSVATGTAAAFQGRNPLQALGQALSQSLGSLLVEVGAKWLKASVLMQQIQTFFAANPVAAIAAAAAMIALGSALGGAGGGRSIGGTTFAGGTQPTPISLSRLIVDPNAGARQRIAAAGQQRSVDAAERPFAGATLLAVDSPRGQEVIGTASDRYNRRRG